MEMALEHGGIPVPKCLDMMIAIRYVNLRTSSWKAGWKQLHERKMPSLRNKSTAYTKKPEELIRRLTVLPVLVSVILDSRNSREKTGICLSQDAGAGINDARNGNVDLKIPVDELLRYLERDKDFLQR